MKTIGVLVTVLVTGGLGFLIKVPDVQQPAIRTSSMGWIHMQKLLLPLFDNVCEESTNPTIVRLAQELTMDSIADSYSNPEMVTNLNKLYTANEQLKKGEIFTELNKDHMYEFELLYDVLYNAQNFDTFYKTAAWARQNVNCGLFVNAIYLALLRRRDTEKVTVPAPYELLPHYFIRQDVIIKASNLLAGGDVTPTESIVNEGNAYILDANYTCSVDANDESKLAYFHEDIGLNTHYFLKRLQYASWFHTEDVNSNYGEFMFHFMKQLSARYNLERYSNGLTLLDRFDWTTCNINAYDPMLVFSNGEEFAPRQSTLDFTSPHYKMLQTIEDKITSAIPVLAQNGNNKAQIINYLMNILVSNLENYESCACSFFGDVAVDNNRYRSVLAHYMTSMRDPVFWKINKKIVNMVDDALKTLPGYTRNELYFPGVQVINVEVKKIMTMFEPFKFEVTDALKTSTDNPMFEVDIVENRLNHKPFTIKVNINSLVSQKGVVKIYLGPKILPGEFAMKKDLFMLLDSFECNLKIGSNVISRTSNSIEKTSPDFVSLKVLHKLVEDAEFGLDVQPLNSLESLSGFPSRLILPKGTPEGLPMQLLIFVAPFTKVMAGGINVIPKTEFNSATLSPGFPFDLDFDDKLFFGLPNVLVKDIVITHKDSSGASKGEYDGAKKWGGGDTSNSYGPDREPFDYNLKKSQYGKTQDYASKKDNYLKPKEDVFKDKTPDMGVDEIDGKIKLDTEKNSKVPDVEADRNDGKVNLDTEEQPLALGLQSSKYENKKYDIEAKRTKYSNKYKKIDHDSIPQEENDKLDSKVDINKNINNIEDDITNIDDEQKIFDDIETVIGVDPNREWNNKIVEVYKKVVPKYKPESIYDIVVPSLRANEYIYE